jgi:hypothetical protein
MLTAAQAHGTRNQGLCDGAAARPDGVRKPVLCGGRRIIYVPDSSQMDVDAIGLFR